MAAKKAQAKKSPSRKSAKKAAPKKGARADLTSASRAAALARVGRRRAFGLVDRLPDDLRDWVRDRFADPSVEYTDIAEHVLLETTHAELRGKLRDDLDWAKRKTHQDHPAPGDGVERAAAYLKIRQDIYRKIADHPKTRAAAKRGEPGGSPVLLSQTVLSRDYRRVAQSIREVEEHLAIAGDMLERIGTRSVSSIGILVANQLLLRLHTFVSEAKTIDELNERKHALNAGSRFFKAVVDYERGDAKSAVAIKRAREQVRSELEAFLSKNPDLRDRLDAFLREKEGVE